MDSLIKTLAYRHYYQLFLELIRLDVETWAALETGRPLPATPAARHEVARRHYAQVSDQVQRAAAMEAICGMLEKEAERMGDPEAVLAAEAAAWEYYSSQPALPFPPEGGGHD